MHLQRLFQIKSKLKKLSLTGRQLKIKGLFPNGNSSANFGIFVKRIFHVDYQNGRRAGGFFIK